MTNTETTDRPTTDNLDRVVEGYAECALWSSLHYAGEDVEPEPMDDHAGMEDISPEVWAEFYGDCSAFIEANGEDLESYLKVLTLEGFGHDFWLTRNGHGAGFWDRGLGDVGDRLTEAAEVYGAVDLYIGSEDGKVYV